VYVLIKARTLREAVQSIIDAPETEKWRLAGRSCCKTRAQQRQERCRAAPAFLRARLDEEDDGDFISKLPVVEARWGRARGRGWEAQGAVRHFVLKQLPGDLFDEVTAMISSVVAADV
jgi:hypothetical protein